MTKLRFAVVGALLILLAAGVFLLVRPKQLGNMRGSYPEETTQTSTISFPAKGGEQFRFLFKSNVTGGDLTLSLYD